MQRHRSWRAREKLDTEIASTTSDTELLSECGVPVQTGILCQSGSIFFFLSTEVISAHESIGKIVTRNYCTVKIRDKQAFEKSAYARYIAYAKSILLAIQWSDS